MPPKGFGTVTAEPGSATQRPSITKRYSCMPGSSSSVLVHRPSPTATMGVAEGCQPLKVPAMQTSEALVSSRVNLTGRCLGGAGSFRGRRKGGVEVLFMPGWIPVTRSSLANGPPPGDCPGQSGFCGTPTGAPSAAKSGGAKTVSSPAIGGGNRDPGPARLRERQRRWIPSPP